MIKYKRYFKSLSDNENWEEYCKRLDISKDNVPQTFFIRHVLFDHYDDFRRRFPWFDLKEFSYNYETWTASSINHKIKYDNNEELDFWYSHVDQNQSFPLLIYMLEQLTWPVPVVIFDFSNHANKMKLYAGGMSPFHLIEGTHRVSYLKKMMLNQQISPNSSHKLLAVQPL